MGTVGGGSNERLTTVAQENPLQSEVLKLRRRWELASVLNFLDVFGPLIGKELRLSAEDIEMGLIKPDASLAQLHVVLLKGMPPVSKKLDESDAWVTELCKKLTAWWPWVAEGKIPIVPSKGEEISKYKELDPLDRLLLLKALCEVRADQHDAVSYIKDALKEGTQISTFRKEAFGGDGKGTFYWYDASAKGHRLYKEIITLNSATEVNGNESSSLLAISSQWETLASNLKEFSRVAEEFSSSNIAAEVVMGKKIQRDAIPSLERLHMNKVRALKRKQSKEALKSRTIDTNRAVFEQVGVRRSKRLAGVRSHTVIESRGLITNHILRQRPIRNSALPTVMLDSDDEPYDMKTD
ncbi:DDT domain-containing protein DDR4 isoform X2 [Neltuma alba]|uniref:DDT domain-containing protein DDR4 isoform X2 n=1 Tax=Neltuma alba TaxID=207710 RepID=UPI0010A35EC4|nr:DDT domain-containing protein DDR4 isoform X2 [Prosopis alba]